jgi:hypothetical protein
MIKKVIAFFPDLSGVVGIDQYGHAAMKAPSRFQTIITASLNVSLEEEIAGNLSQGRKMPRSGRHAMLSRWVKLWAPFDRKLIIHAIVLPDGSLATAPSDKADALAKH